MRFCKVNKSYFQHFNIIYKILILFFKDFKNKSLKKISTIIVKNKNDKYNRR